MIKEKKTKISYSCKLHRFNERYFQKKKSVFSIAMFVKDSVNIHKSFIKM